MDELKPLEGEKKASPSSAHTGEKRNTLGSSFSKAPAM